MVVLGDYIECLGFSSASYKDLYSAQSYIYALYTADIPSLFARHLAIGHLYADDVQALCMAFPESNSLLLITNHATVVREKSLDRWKTFPASGPAAEKARSPKRVLIRRTRRSLFLSDRSRNPEAEECVPIQQSRKYCMRGPVK